MIPAPTMWTVIIAVSVTAFALRGALLLPRRAAEPAPVAVTALRMIPPAAFAALVVPALLRPEGSVDVLSPTLLAGLAAAVVAWRTGRIAATIAVGIVAVVALEQVPALA